MEIGKVYENRNGAYRVLSIENNVVTFNYITGLENNRGSGSMELLRRIHDNIQMERKPVVKSNSTIKGDLLQLAQELLEHGCEIRYIGHDSCLDAFTQEYFDVTGQNLPDHFVSAGTSGWKAYGFSIYIPVSVKVPSSIKTNTHMPGSSAVTVSSKVLGWYLIREGFRLGVNKGATTIAG